MGEGSNRQPSGTNPVKLSQWPSEILDTDLTPKLIRCWFPHKLILLRTFPGDITATRFVVGFGDSLWMQGSLPFFALGSVCFVDSFHMFLMLGIIRLRVLLACICSDVCVLQVFIFQSFLRTCECWGLFGHPSGSHLTSKAKTKNETNGKRSPEYMFFCLSFAILLGVRSGIGVAKRSCLGRPRAISWMS